MHISAKHDVIFATKGGSNTPRGYSTAYPLTGYRAGVLLRYYHTGRQRAVLPLAALGKSARVSCPPVPASLAVFEKIYICRGIVVRAFASQLEDLGSTLVESDETGLKKLVFTVSLLSVKNKPESLLVVFLGKAVDGIPLHLSG